MRKKRKHFITIQNYYNYERKNKTAILGNL